jgi:hypothetical protein
MTRSPEQQLARMIAKFTPAVADLAHQVLETMRARLPGATELVYDNDNALAIGFGPSERTSDAIFSIALYPRWVSLFFLQGAKLSDPKGLLRGEGRVVRHLVLEDPANLALPGVRALITAAIKAARQPIDSAAEDRIVIKSISKRQRPRRPVGEPAPRPVKRLPRRLLGRRPK